MASMGQKVIVVGGGPVGALAALYAVRRGYQVELYDLRDDPNFGDPTARPALALIPLTLSERGIRAIADAGVPELAQQILNDSRPVRSRMVHTRGSDGRICLQPTQYGPNGEVLHILPREKIAKHLLLALGKEPTAKLFFNQKLLTCDLDKKTATFESVNWKAQYASKSKPNDDREVQGASFAEPGQTQTVSFGFLFGCDGAYSNVRQCMMKKMDMDYEVSYIHANWYDIVIPSAPDGSYRMDPGSLHVWPDKDSMVIALPDFDGSFRAGMIVPQGVGTALEQHQDNIQEHFSNRYAGLVPDMLPIEDVTRQLRAHQRISLKSIKCSQFGYRDAAVLLGDAAHSMTPFYGVGMVSGLEDVRIFFEQFRDPMQRVTPAVASVSAHKEDRRPFCPPGVLDRYTAYRRPDVQAITDMAAEHYQELRAARPAPMLQAIITVQAWLQRKWPSLGFKTIYSRIQFSHERFSMIRKSEAEQKKILGMFWGGLSRLSVCGFIAAMWMFAH